MTGAASAASPTETLGLPTPRRHWAAAGIWLALALSVLDSSVANIALPVIARDLHALPADTIRVVNAYQLAIVVSVLPLAALGEIIGYRRVYKTGVAIFTLASLICVLSHSLPMLITARALQGFGAAGIMSVNSALVRYIYPPHLLGRGVGLNSLVIALCAAIGPSIASAILAVAHWQWLFGINVPTGIFALIVGWKTLPTTPKVARRFPIVSTALNVALFFLAVTGVDALAEGKNVWLSCLAILGAILAGVALVRRSLSQEAPLIPIDLLRIKTFSLSVLCSLGAFSGQMAAFVSLPFHFETAMHRSQVETGLLMTPWPVGVACAAPLAGRLIERFPAALIGSIGSATLMTGLAAMALLPADAADWNIVWRMALCGIGFGLYQTPNNQILLSSAPIERAGAASGMLAMSRLTGQTFGATVAVVLFRLTSHGDTISLAIAPFFASAAAFAGVSRFLSGRRRGAEKV